MTTALLAAHPALALAREQLRVLGVGDPVALEVGWAGPVRLPLTGEELVQAACGIMHVHGRARGGPVALAVDYATAVAGVLAAQGVLAALFARARGLRADAVRTSVAQAALLSVAQYVAHGPVSGAGTGSPPPFRSADGVRFEIETLRAEDWQRFWRAAGVADDVLRRAWRPFADRFATAVCPLPGELHTALRRLPFAAVRAAGTASGVSVVPLGATGPVPPWEFTPPLRPGSLAGGTAPAGGGCGRPLAGVRVVESARRVQGPLAGHVLAMLGADVLRIEPPGGDPARGEPPLRDGVSARFAALNAGKRVVELDLATAEGRSAARELAASAEVFLHNWAPGRDRAWRLTAADLAAVRPGLVYAAASGWGPRPGPRPPLGTDFVVQARSGLAAAVRPPGEPPAPSLMTLVDVLGGLVCAQGVLAALVARERAGAGRAVHTSLVSAAGLVPRRRGERLGPVRTLDGHVVLSRPAPEVVGTAPEREPTAALLDRLGAHGVAAVAVAADPGALARDPRVAPALAGPPWEFG